MIISLTHLVHQVQSYSMQIQPLTVYPLEINYLVQVEAESAHRNIIISVGGGGGGTVNDDDDFIKAHTCKC